MLFRISCLDHVIADPIIEVEDDQTSDSETGTKHYSQAGCVSNAFVIFHYACLGVFSMVYVYMCQEGHPGETTQRCKAEVPPEMKALETGT